MNFKRFVLIVFILFPSGKMLIAQEKDTILKKEIEEVNICEIIGSDVIRQALPGSAHYIGNKELQRYHYSDVNRQLNKIPGVNIQEEDGFGLRPNISMRGVGTNRSEKITLMEDGILIAPAAYSAPEAYYFPTAFRMSAMEVLKGSSQIRFGPQTGGGVLNLVSTPVPKNNYTRIKAFGGSFGTTGVFLSAGTRVKNLSFLLEGLDYRSRGFKTISGNMPLGFNIQDVIVKIRYDFFKTRFPQFIQIKYGKNDQQSYESYLGLTYTDYQYTPFKRYSISGKDKMELRHQQYVLSHEIYLSSHTYIHTDVYKTRFSRNWYKLDKVGDSIGTYQNMSKWLESSRTILTERDMPGYLYIKANNRKYGSLGLQSVVHSESVVGKVNVKSYMGIRLHRDFMDRFQWADEYQFQNQYFTLLHAGIPGSESNAVYSARAFSSYGGFEIGYKKMKIYPGVRYEFIRLRYTDYGKMDTERIGNQSKTSINPSGRILPGIGCVYSPDEQNHLIAGIHKGFSPQGFSEYSKPEESWNYEFGFRKDHSLFSMNLIAFYTKYKNLLGSDNASVGGQGNGESYNAGKARIYGLESSWGYIMLKNKKWYSGINVVYNYNNAQFLETFESKLELWEEVKKGDEIPYIPHHQGNIQWELRYLNFSFNYNIRYQSKTNAKPSPELTEIIPAFSISDISFIYSPREKWQVFANLLNVYNTTYLAGIHPAGYRPGMPRMFQMGVDITF